MGNSHIIYFKDNSKKLVKLLIIIVLLISFSINLSGCSKGANNNENDKNIEDKVNEEIKYIGSNIFAMLNNANNITFRNYTVSNEYVDIQSGNTDDEGTSEENSKLDEDKSESDQENLKTESKPQVYKTIPNKMLTNNKDPDWNNIKTNIENINSYWSSIVIDLYKLNISNEDILGFSSQLNITITSIRDENKRDTLINLANLYAYLPKYINAYSKDELLKNIMYTKSHIFNAYALIEFEKYDEIKSNLIKAEEYYMNIVNKMELTQKHYNINKGYILLKEFQNSVDQKDKDVLLIKYKEAIEEINLL